MSNNKQPAELLAKKRIVMATGIALSLMAAQSVWAQQTAAVERVEITGTRLPAPSLEGASPVTSFTAESIKIDGVRNVEDILNNLPQVFADFGSTASNGSTGTATVNLRNLGSVRTLVLVNGRRLPAGSPLVYATDLNQIPAPLIKRVDLLTAGASAIYGSDAVAGVVNFIMNDKFQGVQFQMNANGYNHKQQNASGVADVVRTRAITNPSMFIVPGDKNWDGRSTEFNVTAGSNFADGKGNATIFFGYTDTKKLLQSERDFSSCAVTAGNTFTCGGSSTSFPGRFLIGGTSFTVADAAGNTRRYAAATDQYNYAPLNYYQRPDERYTFSAFAHLDINDKARVYNEFSFHDDHTIAQIAPSGAFAFQSFNISSDNPLLTPAWNTAFGFTGAGQNANLLLARRNVEGGGRQDDLRHTSFREVFGVKGELLDGWNYDAFMQVGKVIYQETYKNDFSKVRLQRAMNVVSVGGVPTCQSVVDGTDPNCVPWNIWKLGGVSQAAVQYLSTPGFQKGYTSQSVQGFTLDGDLGKYGVKSPAAKNAVTVAVGVERRVEKLELSTDTAFTSNDLAGQGGPRIGLEGQYTVKELFGEFRAPLIEGRPMAELLSVNGSYRTSNYDNAAGRTDSFGVGAEWAPVKLGKMRASYQKAVRAPNIIEQYTAPGLGLFNNNSDPCAGAVPTATAAQCARTGVTAAQYGTILENPAGQYNLISAGSTLLKPEVAKSMTFGVVLTPIKDLSATIDFFSMKVDKVISTQPPSFTLAQCLSSGQFCNLINRDPASGTIWASDNGFIRAPLANLSVLETRGIDVGANYAKSFGSWGKGTFSFLGTHLAKSTLETLPGVGAYDCKGLYGSTCGTPSPTWRHKARAMWSTPWNLDLALSWRYMGKVDLDLTSSNPLLADPASVTTTDKTISARNYFDVFGSYRVTKMITLAGGINNLFDKDPPITGTAGAPFGNGNTYPQVYDALGRRMFVNLTAKF